MHRISVFAIVAAAGLTCFVSSLAAAAVPAYCRTPAIAPATSGGWSGAATDEVIVFVSEGDLWKVAANGGTATRLTSHPGDESQPLVSDDGSTIAFNARYEGPVEIYTMPLGGGLPIRRTWDGGSGRGGGPTGFTHDGKLLYTTNAMATLPDAQMVMLDLASGAKKQIELSQASDGSIDPDTGSIFFTRLPMQGSNTKRYKGGTAQQIWRWDGKGEAVPLTKDFDGTSKRPMTYKGRVYFATDRDGTMNIWSMNAEGKDLKQLTTHKGFDVIGPNISRASGTIVYQLGADIWKLDAATGKTAMVNISIESDMDHQRERWVKKPTEWMTSAHISPDGEKVALTARGQVFVAQAKHGRLVDVHQLEGSRSRDARFLKDNKTLVTLTDTSGEVELWTAPANGVGEVTQLTTDATVLRWQSVPSPDGKYIVHDDKDLRVWLYDTEKKTNIQIDQGAVDNFASFTWSPDGMFLAYTEQVDNFAFRIKVYSIADGSKNYITSDRYDSSSPAWSTDGKWLYFLSDRNLQSTVSSPWGPLQPEPFFDNRTRIYAVGLTPGQRWPFAPMDEVQQAKDEAEKAKKKEEKKDDTRKDEVKKEPEPAPPDQLTPDKKTEPVDPAKPATEKSDEKKNGNKDDKKDEKKPVKIDFNNIIDRIYEVPVEPGNYSDLSATEKAIFWTSRSSEQGSKNILKALTIGNENIEVKTVLADIRGYELSGDGKKMLIQKGDTLAIVDAAAAPADLSKKEINLAGWQINFDPRTEWRQMYTESWRLMRDYFYDPAMHGVNWKAMKDKYAPLVDRVTNRVELADIMAQMVGELSTLHHFVQPGDIRKGPDNVGLSTLGAVLERDNEAGGHRVVRIYKHDPQEPGQASPLVRAGVDMKEGDIIEAVNGIKATNVADLRELIRDRDNLQVLLRVKSALPAGGYGESRDVVIQPISSGQESDLRYDEWEYTRRQIVEEQGKGELGYLHLRAMGSDNIAEFAKNYYPIFNRKGLIIDVRHNRGGNIDSWILEKLMRKVWMYWSQRIGRGPNWNMQYAFRGHMVVLCNEFTASDGEAFSDGFRRLGLGKTIGTRTWGGEVWLSSSNILVDRGIATASEFGVFAPDGQWLIEGHGFEPDIVVDNLPHATFKGEDAQLKAGIEYLQKLIIEKPVDLPPIPKYPVKNHETNR